MKKQHCANVKLIAFAIVVSLSRIASAQYAVQVVSYNQGTNPHIDFETTLPQNLSQAALGQPTRLNGGDFPAVVSPFDPPFRRNDIVSIGAGGQLTLRLSNYAVPQAGGPEIGVFSNAFFADSPPFDGEPQTPVSVSGNDSAFVEVSADGVIWTSLNGGSAVNFSIPSNGYADAAGPYDGAPGSVPSDFQQPFTSPLSSFDGLPYHDAGGPDMLDLLAGSGGGTWLDISSTGLPQVGYIRFSVASGTSSLHTFELDAVSVSHAALGTATVPEPATLLLVASAVLFLGVGRRRFRMTRDRYDRS